MKLNKKSFRAFYLPIGILILWELLGQARYYIEPSLIWFGFNPDNIPEYSSFFLPVSKIFPQFIKIIIDGTILEYFWDTLWRSIVGFVLATICGIFIGIPIGIKKKNEELLLPTIDALRTIPPVALLPLIILLFGIDDSMKIVFIFIGSIWPIIINTAQAIKSVDPMYLKVSDNAGHSAKFKLRRVIIPASLPGIFAGIKISLSISVILSIVGEMMIGNTGLGYYLNYAKRNFEYDTMYATIIIIAMLGFALNRIINALDYKLLSWYYKSRDAQLDY